MSRIDKQIQADFRKYARYNSRRINHPYSIVTTDRKELISNDTRDLFLQFEKHEKELK